MQWVVHDPKRFLHEQIEVDRLYKEADWLEAAVWGLGEEFAVKIDFVLKVHGNRYELSLVYPEVFPESPCYIRPREPSLRLSGHQYGPGGSLCLEWRADNWDTRVTGADLMRSAYRLLTVENDPSESQSVPSSHRVTFGQSMRNNDYRFVCTPEALSGSDSLQNESCLQLQCRSVLHRSAIVVFISQIEMPAASTREIGDLPPGIKSHVSLFSWPCTGILLKSQAFDQPSTISSLEDLIIIISRAGFSDQLLQRDAEPAKFKEQIVMLVGNDTRSMRVFGLESGEKSVLREYSVILPEPHASRLPSEHTSLANVRVGMVGLGSLGSKVAVSMARSGVRKFLLVDDDLLTVENLCRHELSWAAVGLHKTEAVREALSLVAPGIDLSVRTHRVAGQESALVAAATLKDLGNCDLLIDATSDPAVFLLLAAIAKMNRRSLCWGEVFAGGCGGLIARARPGIDPNPLAMRAGILNYFERLPPAPHQRAIAYDVDEKEPLIAYDADIGQIASALTRLALDTALKKTPSQFPYSAYLIGLQSGWIFSEPFDTRPIEVEGDCWDNEVVAEADRAEALKILLEIAAAQQNAHSRSST